MIQSLWDVPIFEGRNTRVQITLFSASVPTSKSPSERAQETTRSPVSCECLQKHGTLFLKGMQGSKTKHSFCVQFPNRANTGYSFEAAMQPTALRRFKPGLFPTYYMRSLSEVTHRQSGCWEHACSSMLWPPLLKGIVRV